MNEQEHLTKAGLKERGWTDALIRDFLKEPDQTKRNPHCSSAPPMCLYKVSRVGAVEATDEFAQRMARTQSRRETAKKAAKKGLRTKRKETRKLAMDMPPVPRLDRDELIKRACKHYNKHWELRNPDKYATSSNTPEFLNRICVNYLRHGVSEYDERLGMMYGRVGGKEMYHPIRQKVLRAIADAYPYLAAECYRQGLEESDS